MTEMPPVVCWCNRHYAHPKWFPFCSKTCKDFYFKNDKKDKK